ncbi:MAG TPA: hypothetical protein VI542_24580 [Candidatus Tectomicrobia bacterium]
MITRAPGFGDAYSDPELSVIAAQALAGGDMRAAADALGPGTIVTPMYQPEILDMVRRRGIWGQRIKNVPATGHPSRYFEQTRIVRGVFQDPRNLSYQPGQDPTRRERYVMVKAIYGSLNFTLFDVEVTRQQGQFGQLVAKDIEDMVMGTLGTSDIALWNGNDTSLVLPTTLEYVGALTQINRTASIASSASIVDGLKAEVASLQSQMQFQVNPTAIYVNPVLGDLIDAEERGNQRQIPMTQINTVTGGLTVRGLATGNGMIPLIQDAYLQNGVAGASATETGKTDYTAVILTESLCEYHYITAYEPRVFQLGLEGSLATRYVCVMFGAPIYKGVANSTQSQGVVETNLITYAHSRVTVTK